MKKIILGIMAAAITAGAASAYGYQAYTKSELLSASGGGSAGRGSAGSLVGGCYNLGGTLVELGMYYPNYTLYGTTVCAK